MLNPLKFIFPFLLLCSDAEAKDAFTELRCNADIQTAIKGKRLPTGNDAHYKHLGLIGAGADIVTDNVNSISWILCGRKVTVLEKNDLIRDVLVFPARSESSIPFLGTCEKGGRAMKHEVDAILDGTAPIGNLLQVRAAWRIDAKAVRFIKVDTKDMACPRTGVKSSADGG